MLQSRLDLYQLDVLSSPFEPFVVSGLTLCISGNILLLLDEYALSSPAPSSMFSEKPLDSAASSDPEINTNPRGYWRSKYGGFGGWKSPNQDPCLLENCGLESAQWSFNYDLNSLIQVQDNLIQPRRTFRRDSTQRAKRLGDLLFKSIFRNK